MKKFFLLLSLFLILLSGISEAKNIKGEFLVKYKTTPFDVLGIKSLGLDSLEVRAFLKAQNAVLLSDIKTIGVLHIYKEDAELSIMPVLDTDKIEYFEPNQYQYAINSVNNEENLPIIPSDQWGLNAIDVLDAWIYSIGSPEVIVGVIDSGVDYNHFALKQNMWDDGEGHHGYNFVHNNEYPMDDNDHGTHCAGVIAANSTKYMGVAPNVKIMALKFLSKEGYGSTASAIKAIEYGVKNGAKILSNSWGGGSYSNALADAIHYANLNNVLFVAAAGNENNDNDKYPSYPANYKIDNVISVGAMDYRYRRASFSNYGETSVHVFGPGVSILSTVPNNRGSYMSGTSMATPFISGISALILSYYPDIEVKEVREILVKTSVKKESLSDFSISGGFASAKTAFNFMAQD